MICALAKDVFAAHVEFEFLTVGAWLIQQRFRSGGHCGNWLEQLLCLNADAYE